MLHIDFVLVLGLHFVNSDINGHSDPANEYSHEQNDRACGHFAEGDLVGRGGYLVESVKRDGFITVEGDRKFAVTEQITRRIALTDDHIGIQHDVFVIFIIFVVFVDKDRTILYN